MRLWIWSSAMCDLRRSGCCETDAKVTSVAEGLVLGPAAAAQSYPRVLADHFAAGADDANAAADEERAVRTGFDRRLVERLLLRPAVEPPVPEGAGRARLDRRRDRIGVGGVDLNPGPGVGPKDVRQTAHAVPHVDAQPWLPVDLDCVTL